MSGAKVVPDQVTQVQAELLGRIRRELRAAMEQRGLTATEVAYRMGVPYQNVTALLSGRRKEVTLATLARLSLALGSRPHVSLYPRDERG
jgi:plasmid maintenance system antidote protein VapI